MKLLEIFHGPDEIWRTIDDHPDYEISNIGRVRNARTGRVLKPQEHYGRSKNVPYHRVKLNRKNRRINRLVAKAFHDNPENHSDVDHIDQDSLNNRFDNLRWLTSKGNAANKRRR